MGWSFVGGLLRVKFYVSVRRKGIKVCILRIFFVGYCYIVFVYGCNG